MPEPHAKSGLKTPFMLHLPVWVGSFGGVPQMKRIGDPVLACDAPHEESPAHIEP